MRHRQELAALGIAGAQTHQDTPRRAYLRQFLVSLAPLVFLCGRTRPGVACTRNRDTRYSTVRTQAPVVARARASPRARRPMSMRKATSASKQSCAPRTCTSPRTSNWSSPYPRAWHARRRRTAHALARAPQGVLRNVRHIHATIPQAATVGVPWRQRLVKDPVAAGSPREPPRAQTHHSAARSAFTADRA